MSAEVLTVALPLLTVPLPIEVEPSRKLTVPVMVPLVCDETVAVKVTDWPTMDGFAEEANAVVVAASAAAFTVCVTAVDVLAAKLLLPA